MLVRLVRRSETVQRIARLAPLERYPACDPCEPVAGARDVPRTRCDFGRVGDDQLRLDQIALELKCPSQPEAGIDEESGEDPPLSFEPDPATPRDCLANAAVLAQR
jgi:hypothetical protein